MNFNGAGPMTDAVQYWSCLPPKDLLPPRFVSATTTTLTVDWTMPKILNGCPLQQFDLYIYDGVTQVFTETFMPHISQATWTATGADTSKTFKFQVKATTSGGSITSGSSYLTLAAVPSKPAVPENVASKTNSKQITVQFGTVLPNDGGSPITNIQLWMDDGAGGDFVNLLGGDFASLRTVMTVTDNIVAGQYYRFRYRCQNQNGFSDFSDIIYILAAEVPEKPKAPKLLAATATSIELQFFKPVDNGGAEVTLFELFINDGTDDEPASLVTAYSDN